MFSLSSSGSDDQSKQLPTLSGSQNMYCSLDGIKWDEVKMAGGSDATSQWPSRAGHWTGWWDGQLLMIGGTNNGVDYNDIWYVFFIYYSLLYYLLTLTHNFSNIYIYILTFIYCSFLQVIGTKTSCTIQ